MSDTLLDICFAASGSKPDQQEYKDPVAQVDELFRRDPDLVERGPQFVEEASNHIDPTVCTRDGAQFRGRQFEVRMRVTKSGVPVTATDRFVNGVKGLDVCLRHRRRSIAQWTRVHFVHSELKFSPVLPIWFSRRVRAVEESGRHRSGATRMMHTTEGDGPAVTLHLCGGARGLFAECARHLLGVYDSGDAPDTARHRRQHQEAIELVGRIDSSASGPGEGHVVVPPGLAWSILDDCLSQAIHQLKDATLFADQIDMKDVQNALDRCRCFAREMARLETLDLPTTLEGG
jgi:hypothetical protein